MATIAITMFPEEGHLIPSFKLARMLQAAGHDVFYFGIPDFADYVAAQQIRFVPLLEAEFPRGSRQKQVETLAAGKGIAFLREVSQMRFYQTICRMARATESPLHAFFQNHRPDLCIVDGFLAPIGLLARHLGIPVVTLSININLRPDDNYPPVVTNIVPDNGRVSPRRAKVAWRISSGVRKVSNMMMGLDFDKELRQVAAALGRPTALVEQAALYPRLRPSPEMPELIVCPQAFDFPRSPEGMEGVHYIEPSIDLERAGGSFPWDRLNPEQKLVFCTLGSQSHIYGASRRFFQQAIGALAGRPEYQLVLAVGPHIEPASFGDLPLNVIIVQWAPHAAILKRAALMINHGGLGTLKECIYFDVPMLVFPITRDQPGYAARVAYHGLGLMGDIRSIASEELATMVDVVLLDRSFRARVAAMGAIFREQEQAAQGPRLVDDMLGAARSAPVHDTPAPAQALYAAPPQPI